MKTILYLTLSANGLITQADEAHTVPPEILGDFVQRIMGAGNVVIGRRTFELMGAQMAQSAFSAIETVVVSRSPSQAQGVVFAASPREALEHLEREGFETALVGGGAELDASVLSEGLVDEIYLNLEPIVTSKGIALGAGDDHSDLHLDETVKLSDDIVQLRYKLR
jgi:dihydrofolate reductase